jgi:hypothetical protein
MDEIKVFPNPVNNQLNISGFKNLAFSIEIYNTTGKVKIAVNNYNTIDVSDLTKGIYFVKIRAENNSKIIKFVKQ